MKSYSPFNDDDLKSDDDTERIPLKQPPREKYYPFKEAHEDDIFPRKRNSGRPCEECDN